MAHTSVAPANQPAARCLDNSSWESPLTEMQASLDNAQGIVSVLINEFAGSVCDDGRRYSDEVVLQLMGSLKDLLTRMHEKSMQTWYQCPGASH